MPEWLIEVDSIFLDSEFWLRVSTVLYRTYHICFHDPFFCTGTAQYRHRAAVTRQRLTIDNCAPQPRKRVSSKTDKLFSEQRPLPGICGIYYARHRLAFCHHMMSKRERTVIKTSS
jgi:hypothetical protein